MIKISRYNQIYKEIPSEKDPWKFHVILFSVDDLKETYVKNKIMIKSWISFAAELIVKLDEPGVCIGTTFWIEGRKEFSFNYTLTKISPELICKDLIAPTINWKWTTNETINKEVFGSKNLAENKTKQRISTVQKSLEDNKIKIAQRTKGQIARDKLRGFGIYPMRWLELDDLKKVVLKKTATRVVSLNQVIKDLTKRNVAKDLFYSSIIVFNMAMKLRKYKYRRWRPIVIKVKAFIRIKKYLLFGFLTQGRILYHKPTKTQYVIAGDKLPSHLGIIDKAIRNNQVTRGEVIKVHHHSHGQTFYINDKEKKFTKYKNYKKPRVKIKKADGTIVDSVYKIDQKILNSISKLTSQFRRAKKPIDLNRRSKFADSIIKNCHIIYKTMDQVRQPIEFMNVCWRFLDVITIIRDVLFEFYIPN